MELRQLSHAVTLDILAIRDAILFIFVALALILRHFFIFFLIVASLIKQGRVRIVQDVLRVGTHLSQGVDEALRRLVYLGVSVVKCIIMLVMVAIAVAILATVRKKRS